MAQRDTYDHVVPLLADDNWPLSAYRNGECDNCLAYLHMDNNRRPPIYAMKTGKYNGRKN